MNARELSQMLEGMPQDAKVGRIGHFGEFHEMDAYDFGIRRVNTLPERPGSAYLPGFTNVPDMTVLAINPPDIGPEPD